MTRTDKNSKRTYKQTNLNLCLIEKCNPHATLDECCHLVICV